MSSLFFPRALPSTHVYFFIIFFLLLPLIIYHLSLHSLSSKFSHLKFSVQAINVCTGNNTSTSLRKKKKKEPAKKRKRKTGLKKMNKLEGKEDNESRM
jgi:hypothetical protein